MNKEIVFIGLGRMGATMAANLISQTYVVHGFDVNEQARKKATNDGIKTCDTIADTINSMTGQKIVWLMVPSKFVEDVLDEVHPQLSPGDIIIDGGNSFFRDTLRRSRELSQKKIIYVDCGTSGGVEGARNGASLMVGADKETFDSIEHIFKTLATENGYARVGDTGAGHFVKMVHNGIEYGMMGAIAEGMNLIESEESELNINVMETLKPYENGSIVTSNLMSWLADSYQTDGYLDQIAGEVPVGETEMEMEYITKTYKDTPILDAALKQRKETRINSSRVGTLISAMRNQFGGHKVLKK